MRLKKHKKIVVEHYLSIGKSREDRSSSNVWHLDENEYHNHLLRSQTCQMASKLKDLKHDIGSEVNKATDAIEERNSSLEGVLASIDFNIKDKLLQIINFRTSCPTFQSIDFATRTLSPKIYLGNAYEYLS